MARIEKLPSGNIRALIRRKGHPAVSETFRTRAEAKAWAAMTEADILAGRRGNFLDSMTVRKVFTRYAENVSPTKAGEKWEVIRIEAFIRQFDKLDLADKPFHAIDTPDLARWRDERLKLVTPGTVNREFTLMRNIWTVARREWKLTKLHPFEGLRIPENNPARTRLPTWRENRAILRRLGYRTGHVPTTKMQETAYLYLLALHTAMRASELLRLQDEDIDLEKRVLMVQRKTFHLTKQRRPVPFSAGAARLFRVLMGLGGPLFSVTEPSRDALFRKALRDCGIDGAQFRDSRAHAATRLAKSGQVNVLQLARILDHKDLDQLNRTYFRETAADIAQRL